MYKLNHNSTSITRISDGALIPADPDNTDYAKYLVDVATDPTCVAAADPYVAPIPTITKAQALLWLLSVGKTEDEVLAAINTITDANAKAVALIEWKYREPFNYDNPLFSALAPALGMIPNDLPAAFVAASKL